MERSRAIQLEASLPPSLGPEAFLIAGYALNRTPNKQLGWKTPYEIAYGKPPSLTHIYIYILVKPIYKTNELEGETS